MHVRVAERYRFRAGDHYNSLLDADGEFWLWVTLL